MAKETLREVVTELNNLALLLVESNKLIQAATVYNDALHVIELYEQYHARGVAVDGDIIEIWKRKHQLHQKNVDGLCERRDPSNSLNQISDIYTCQFETIVRAIMRPIKLSHGCTGGASFSDAVVSMVVQHNMGIVLFLANKPDDAVKYFLNASKRKEMIHDKNFSSLYLSVQCALGITYARLENLDKALQALTAALTFRLEYESNKNSTFAAMLQNRGKFYGAVGSDGVAYTFFLGEMLVSCDHQPIYYEPQTDCADTASAAA